MTGGMEDIDGVEVHFLGEEHGIGREGDGRWEVRDDRGERFLVVELDFGWSGCVETGARVYGKKALTEREIWNGVEFSREERGRLEISEEMWEGAVMEGEDEHGEN